jgi:hypothetical protein
MRDSFFLFDAFSTGDNQVIECSGKIFNSELTKDTVIIINFTDYKWWLSLWKNSDVSLKLKTQNENTVFSGHVLEGDKLFQIFGSENSFIGALTKTDMELNLHSKLGLFIGSCN